MAAKRVRLVARTGEFGMRHAQAIRRRHKTAQVNLPAAHFGISAQWHLATAAQRAGCGTFGEHAGGCVGIMQRRHPGRHIRARSQCFNAQRALSGGRQRVFRRQHRTDAPAQAQALQTGRRKDDGIELTLIELAQARVKVTAQGRNGEVGKARMQLRLAAQAGRAHHRARRQIIQARILVGNKRILRRFARADGDQRKRCFHLHRHVLH